MSFRITRLSVYFSLGPICGRWRRAFDGPFRIGTRLDRNEKREWEIGPLLIGPA